MTGQLPGQLYGIGVGPGDPELLTLKALRLLRAAPVVAYPAPETGPSFARGIVAQWLDPGKREIADGDLVSLDCGLILDGLWADSGRTVMVGAVTDEAKRLVEVTRESLQRGIDQAVPGNRIGDISAAVQKHVEANGFSVVRNFVGHGIGRNMHEDPQVPNFGVAGAGPLLKPGYALAIEPMVNAGSHEVEMLPDRWTIITADGKLSAYFEHTVLITDDGPIVATAA